MGSGSYYCIIRKGRVLSDVEFDFAQVAEIGGVAARRAFHALADDAGGKQLARLDDAALADRDIDQPQGGFPEQLQNRAGNQANGSIHGG